METRAYLKMLVEEMHSSTAATIGADGHPQTRVIDMMLWDEKGVYFLTAKGKEFYGQLMEQGYISLNLYMQKIYPGSTRSALEVFQIYEAEGEFFDISDPSHVTRDRFVIGDGKKRQTGYFVGQGCIGCKLCYSVCPQKCIDIAGKPVVIDQNRCLHCGRCAEICPKQVIEKRQ